MLETFGGKKSQYSCRHPSVVTVWTCHLLSLCVCVRCAGFCAMPGPHVDSCLLVFGTVGESRVSVGAWDRHRPVSLIIAHCKQTAVNLRRVHDNNNQAEVPEIRKDQTSFTLTPRTSHNTLIITHY